MKSVASFDERVAARLAGLSPAEQRVVLFFQTNREEVLIASAAALAARTKTSDATVLRTAKSLGFASLEELRRALASELRRSLSPADRLAKTLEEVCDGR
jgi:DNA-binding MurR/RpiR family transcriptional regulator